ncbi:MAG: hypothetical protein ACREUW_19565 [Burkholderiales bacterium]
MRTGIGLARGQVFRKLSGADVFPDVLWALEFPDMSAQDADMAARAASPEFETVRAGMRQLYQRFERPLFDPIWQQAGAADAAYPHVTFEWVITNDTGELVEQMEQAAMAHCRATRGAASVLQRLTEEDALPLLVLEMRGKAGATQALARRGIRSLRGEFSAQD